MLCWLDRNFLLVTFIGLLIPTVIGGLVTMSWLGALTGFLWGGPIRIMVEHHVTWSVNSICHIWGSQPYDSHDESRNNAIVGVLALGEGWHNNHHAFPHSARHGLRWWQFDSSWVLIRLCGRSASSGTSGPERETPEEPRFPQARRTNRDFGGKLKHSQSQLYPEAKSSNRDDPRTTGTQFGASSMAIPLSDESSSTRQEPWAWARRLSAPPPSRDERSRPTAA